MNKIKLVLLSAISLASVSLFSCSSDDSSNSVSVDKYEYCVFADDKLCLVGPFSSCESGGRLSNSCPYGDGSVVSSSSSSINYGSVYSSSSLIVGSSSSSSWVSSSSAKTLSSSSSTVSSSSNFVINYESVTIGTQVWMKKNLNIDAPYSYCYDHYSYNDVNSGRANCDKYGRLYGYNEAKTVCPSGWHLPSYDEWDILFNYVGGKSVAGKKLKATSEWKNNEGVSGNGTDDYGFAALPGGYGEYTGSYYFSIGSIGKWWSASVSELNGPYRITITTNSNSIYSDVMDYYSDTTPDNYIKSDRLSVRCLKN